MWSSKVNKNGLCHLHLILGSYKFEAIKRNLTASGSKKTKLNAHCKTVPNFNDD